MKDEYIKLFIGLVLFAAWMFFVIDKTQGAEDIISAIKLALLGLGAYHLNNYGKTSIDTAPQVVKLDTPKPESEIIKP